MECYQPEQLQLWTSDLSAKEPSLHERLGALLSLAHPLADCRQGCGMVRESDE
jgi:hypothetical protein